MSSGIRLSGSIDAGLEDLRKQEAALAEHLRQAADTVNTRHTEQAAAYRELAALRLDEIAAGELNQAMDAAEARAQQLLNESARAHGAAKTRHEGSLGQLEKLEAEIETQNDVIATADEALDGAEAALQEVLGKDQAYKAQATATEEAVRIADEAERKTVLSEEDRTEKGKPYEDDPLFMYLWNRGYGTSEYRAWGLIKALDHWVARLCRYQQARPNYAMLLEIPERLRAHTARVQEQAEGQIAALEELELTARNQHGVTSLERALRQEQEKLEALEERRSALQEQIAGEERELGKFARGEDENAQAAVEVLTEELKRDTLNRLRREAILTPDRRDDRIVDRIGELEREIDIAEEDVAMRQQSLRVLADRRAELETVRSDMRKRRYNTDDFEFNDYGALQALLEGLLRGAVSGSQYWRELERNSRRKKKRRANINFGSRNYRPSSTSWTRTSTRSSGGFRTGGSFGRSSGFKTGGGF